LVVLTPGEEKLLLVLVIMSVVAIANQAAHHSQVATSRDIQ
jgi:hypothetical protein